ncbi:hypothetical protein [Sulfurirhabdus autotrophica]|uniref:Uncharacterized protein n=1 Tax=Sulfurirhabdus autotrophica TaxID=1706046 RepID=A0A4R3YCM1_9PROT|nr:hypothetical protein [Sulfurirhabdus autotrophica]TCV89562.1 hypothetical protein EDC63_10280 [Sulfurirhabdus autotrophica]
MLNWISDRITTKEPQAVHMAMKQPVVLNDFEWLAPNQSLDAIEVKELSIAEFMAIYKLQNK